MFDLEVNTQMFISTEITRQIGQRLENKTLELEANGSLGDFPLTERYILDVTIPSFQEGKHYLNDST